MAEIHTDVPGALWTLDLIEANRVRETPPLVYVVVAIDPMIAEVTPSTARMKGRGDGHRGGRPG